MKITYDREVDAAYVQIATTIAPGEAATQVIAKGLPREVGDITLDFDSEGHLLGIEVLQAKATIPPDVLSAAGEA